METAETINTQPPERVTQPRVHRPKYKAVTVKRLLKYIASGLNITQACIAAGIDRRTYYVWRVSHPELDSLLEKAREECRLRALAAIKVAAKDDWRAMVEFLKLSYHNDYQRNGNTVNVGVQGNASIEVTDVERARLIEQRERALSDKGEASEPLQLTDGKENVREIALETERRLEESPGPVSDPEPQRLRERPPKTVVERADWREARRQLAQRDEVDEILDF